MMSNPETGVWKSAIIWSKYSWLLQWNRQEHFIWRCSVVMFFYFSKHLKLPYITCVYSILRWRIYSETCDVWPPHGTRENGLIWQVAFCQRYKCRAMLLKIWSPIGGWFLSTLVSCHRIHCITFYRVENKVEFVHFIPVFS